MYHGQFNTFLEHSCRHPGTGRQEEYILVLCKWVTRELKLGRQQQIFAAGKRDESNIFAVKTVENASLETSWFP